MGRRIRSYSDFMSEDLEPYETTSSDELEISIEAEKDSKGIETGSYDVEYKRGDIEISGQLVAYDTGRTENLSFEPSHFVDKASEEYYDANWEDIEEDIKKHLDD